MIDIKSCSAKYLKDNFDLEPEVVDLMFDVGILQPHTMRNVLIKHEFEKRIEPKEKERVKVELADKFCVSYGTIKRITDQDFS